jgi:hypothetical protein
MRSIRGQLEDASSVLTGYDERPASTIPEDLVTAARAAQRYLTSPSVRMNADARRIAAALTESLPKRTSSADAQVR